MAIDIVIVVAVINPFATYFYRYIKPVTNYSNNDIIIYCDSYR